jgi:hypothetical protein
VSKSIVTKNAYPKQLDWVWLATDREDHIAAFITAGSGPIPLDYLNSPLDVFECDLESECNKLPIRGAVELLIDLRYPESDVDLASRGCFTFDWFDVHRTYKDSKGKYEAIARPAEPIRLASVPSNIAIAATRCIFRELVFSHETRIDVRRFFDCVSGESD